MDLKKNKILKGLELLIQDYEKDLQTELYKWLCSISLRMSTKFSKVKETFEKSDEISPDKKPKLEFENVIFAQDFSAKLETVEEYSEYHYGLKSVLDDIIQLDANQSKIDTIDCI